MKACLVNYNYTPDWLQDYDLDYVIYDRSDSDEYLKYFPPERIIKTKNIGNVDYDKLGYIIDHYHDLPEVFLWGKTNLFKYITKEEFDAVKDNVTFTPLLTQNHKTYSDEFGPVCYYSGGLYHERNNSWYRNTMAYRIPSFQDFASYLHIPAPGFIPFAPGGNYILTREVVHKYGVDFYKKMRALLPYTQLPAEAHYCERSYFCIWA